MSRPGGVTASAVVAILGSILMLLLAVFSVVSLFIKSPQAQPPNSAQIVAGAAIFTTLAGLGMWTAIGLFRLRPWARISMLVFAGFTAACCILSLVVALTIPIPPTLAASKEHSFRLGMAVVFAIPLAIAIWWLIQFNTQSTKTAFASSIAEDASARPLSITVIAWAMIVGGASLVFMILARTPVFLFGVILEGWSAGVIYAFFGALSLYVGKGLLDLRERARVVAIGWFGFSLVHSALVALVPPLRERMLALQRTLEQNQPNPISFDQGIFANVILAICAVMVVTVIWLLVRNRAAFVRAETTLDTGV